MALATLSNKSRIVLPAEIRRQLQLNPGDKLEIEVAGDHIVVRKAPVSYLEALERCASDLWQGYENELKKARDQWDV